MNVRAERFPLFDALRAIAAISVLVYHASYVATLTSPDRSVTRYTEHLDVGVTVFFMISGFLLYRPFVRARMTGQPLPGPAAYGWRRLLRIAPAYWVALTLVALWLPLPYVFGGSGPAIYYLFGQIYVVGDWVRGIGQAWTLCVEVTFYAFLPLWALALRKAARSGDRAAMLRAELLGLAGLFVLSTAYKLWALHQYLPTDLRSLPLLMPLPGFLDQFALGMGVAVLSVFYEGWTLPAPLALVRRAPEACWALALAGFVVVSAGIGFNGDFFQSYGRAMFLERYELYTLIGLALLLATVFAVPGQRLVGRLQASAPLRYLGLISYAIYLYHLAILYKLERWLAGSLPAGFTAHFLIYLALGLVSTVAVATVSYYVVERPALRLKRLVRSAGAPVDPGGPGASSPPAAGEAIAEPTPASPEAVR